MKKRILVLCKTERNRTPYDKWAKEANVDIVILTDKKYYDTYLPYVEKTFLIENYDTATSSIIEMAQKIHETLPIDYVFCRAEVDVIRAAQIRERLGLPGQNQRSAIAFRDKFEMKKAVSKSSVAIPKFEEVSSLQKLLRFSETHGFPLIVKPKLASGSSGIEKIGTRIQLEDWFNSHASQADSYLVESFVSGKMYHVDGFVRDGKVAFIQPFEYINDCLSYRDDMFIGNVPVSDNHAVFEALFSSTKEVISALPFTEHFPFHCELWIEDSGQIVFCEIASRTGGGMISFLVKEAFDVNIDKECFLAECKVIKPFTAKQPSGVFGAICIPPRSGRLLNHPNSLPQSVVFEHFTGELGSLYFGGEKSGLYLYGFILSASSRDNLIEDFEKCYSSIHCNSLWEQNDKTVCAAYEC